MRVRSVELWRLLFAVSILLCHGMSLPWNSDPNGEMMFRVSSLGVEFFFMLSGYLMAQSVSRNTEPPTSLGSETTQFLKRKIMSIIGIYIFAAVFELVVNYTIRPSSSETGVRLNNIWDITFLRAFGLGNTEKLLVGATWYLFALFSAIWILYPLLRKYTNTFLHIIAPLTGFFLLGWFSQKYGHINFALHTDNYICLGLLRAIAELCVGCYAYCICEELKKVLRSDKPSVLLTILEIAAFALVFLFNILYDRGDMDFICILLLFVGLVAAFSGKSYTNVWLNKVPNSVITFSSQYSIAIYLNHYVWADTFIAWNLPVPHGTTLLIYTLLSLFTAFACLATVRAVSALWAGRHKATSK